jgi:acetolactate synthase I/II/III large subunit
VTATDERIDRSEVGATREMQGGRIVAEMLRLHEVGPMFGMGGFQMLPMYGAVRELGLEHHLINDERSGAFAADAYARVTGRVGVCDATLGPGATNLVTALVESLNAGIPIVAVVGDADRSHVGKHMTQEADQASILRPAVKQLIRAESAERIPELMRRAFAIATSGRPGPVALDVPEDVSHGTVTIPVSELWADPVCTSVPSRRSRPDAETTLQASALLAAARRPLILVGGGVHLSRAYAQLLAFVEELDVPVAHTIGGKGALACVHPRSIGVFGRYSRTANEAIARADLLMAVGTKLGEIATKRYELLPPETPLIHIEVDPHEIGRTARVRIGLVGDCGLALQDLLDASRGLAHEPRQAWLDDIDECKRRWRADAATWLTSSERPISVARLVQELNGVLPEEAVVIADGGFASHWTGLLYDTKTSGRRYIADRGFASIGYGLPGAIGAALAVPDGVPVVAITGDAGLNLSLGELETAVRVGKPLILIVVNNAASGYVKALQHFMLDGRYQSSDLTDLDYAAIARAVGCEGIRIEDPDEISAAFRRALATRGPVVLDIIVTRDAAKMLPGLDSRMQAAVRAGGGRVV